MKHFTVKVKDGQVDFNFPTSIKELDAEYLLELVDNVDVADHYSIIALCYEERLANLILAARNNSKDKRIKVTPIFVKAGKTDATIINSANVKDYLTIANTQVAISPKLAVPNNLLTLNYFANIVINSTDKDLYTKELANEDQSNCLFIEFKLIPNVDIISVIKPKEYKEDKFKYVQVTKDNSKSI